MTLNTNTKIACAVLAVAFTFGTVAVPAQAETVEFGYRAADLADPAAVYARIQRTARPRLRRRFGFAPDH